MPTRPVSEQQILEALQHLPANRWADVLDFIGSLQKQECEGGASATAIRTTHDLAQSEMVGLWADRTDLSDSRAFARQLRERAEHRGEGIDAAGH